MLFGKIAPKSLYYLAFQSFDFEGTWWRSFQKHVGRTKFDIFVFILAKILLGLFIYEIYGSWTLWFIKTNDNPSRASVTLVEFE